MIEMLGRTIYVEMDEEGHEQVKHGTRIEQDSPHDTGFTTDVLQSVKFRLCSPYILYSSSSDFSFPQTLI